jgi:hypothetical protein
VGCIRMYAIECVWVASECMRSSVCGLHQKIIDIDRAAETSRNYKCRKNEKNKISKYQENEKKNIEMLEERDNHRNIGKTRKKYRNIGRAR